MSTLKVNTIQNTSGTEMYLAKAWVNFNGTGTVAIRSAGNVSSITDNSTGNYTVNFTNAMPDANYAVVSGLDYNNTGVYLNLAVQSYSQATSSVRISTGDIPNNTKLDLYAISLAIFR